MASSSSSSFSEERKAEAAAKRSTTYKTKVIQFLGRTTPIILQNDNGPCPLLAICNVLLLKNNLKLSPDVAEVSQEQLLSLIAERLIDSNSNVDNKDAGYVENQQQNISDAIDLLPRLTTGIDVNIKFNRIGDFEFTRECTIFDLLDIPLYHGWIVDPEDIDTVRAIGSKSYNTLMGDLVGLETQNAGTEFKKNPKEDCVNFSATTAATLRVPSPSVSRGVFFDESIGSVPDELLRASKLQEGEIGAEIQKSSQQEPSISDDIDDVASCSNDLITFEGIPGKKDVCLSSNIENEIPSDQSNCEESGQVSSGAQVLHEAAVSDSCGSDLLSENGSNTPKSVGSEQVQEQSKLRPDIGNGSEPIYGGEEHILESGPTIYEDLEPVYEGQVVPAEQVEKNSDVGHKNEMTPEQGELIKNFLKNCASQLTIYGLLCLQDGLKERELCVFFRNNHFNTMFKFDGELYILATDQGYLNQPDLVWEKLNEVNGNTVFMTGSFKEFKIEENHANSSWDNIADYFGSSIDSPAEDHSSVDADRQIALALQNEEYEARQQQRNSQKPPVGGGSSRPLVTGPQVSKRSSGRNLPTPTKPEPKSSKDKMCVIM